MCMLGGSDAGSSKLATAIGAPLAS